MDDMEPLEIECSEVPRDRLFMETFSSSSGRKLEIAAACAWGTESAILTPLPSPRSSRLHASVAGEGGSQ